MGRKSKYTIKLLEPIVQESHSMAQVLRKLGLKTTGGNHRNILQRIRYLGISRDHFTGQGWAKGKTRETDERIDKCARKNEYPDEEVFIENARPMSGGKLSQRLKKLGWEYKCSKCGLMNWQGKPLTLHVDHINGIGNDNRFKNLRFLCPNCHQQTETWGNGIMASKSRGEQQHKNVQYQARKTKLCPECGVKITRKAKFCNACMNVKNGATRRDKFCKIDWPDIKVLREMVTETSYLAVGRKLGVSDNAVRKRIKTRQESRK